MGIRVRRRVVVWRVAILATKVTKDFGFNVGVMCLGWEVVLRTGLVGVLVLPTWVLGPRSSVVLTVSCARGDGYVRLERQVRWSIIYSIPCQHEKACR